MELKGLAMTVCCICGKSYEYPEEHRCEGMYTQHPDIVEYLGKHTPRGGVSTPTRHNTPGEYLPPIIRNHKGGI